MGQMNQIQNGACVTSGLCAPRLQIGNPPPGALPLSCAGLGFCSHPLLFSKLRPGAGWPEFSRLLPDGLRHPPSPYEPPQMMSSSSHGSHSRCTHCPLLGAISEARRNGHSVLVPGKDPSPQQGQNLGDSLPAPRKSWCLWV